MHVHIAQRGGLGWGALCPRALNNHTTYASDDEILSTDPQFYVELGGGSLHLWGPHNVKSSTGYNEILSTILSTGSRIG